MARPLKYSDELAKKIAEAIEAGMSKAGAAELAGIAYETLRDWERRGEREEGPFSAFSVAIKKAEAAVEKRCIGIILDAASAGTWQAAGWWLERRKHADYALRYLEQQAAAAAQQASAAPIPLPISLEDEERVLGVRIAEIRRIRQAKGAG